MGFLQKLSREVLVGGCVGLGPYADPRSTDRMEASFRCERTVCLRRVWIVN